MSRSGYLPSGGGVSRPGLQCGAAWSSAVPGSSSWSPRPAPARTRPRALTGRCARSRRRRSARIARFLFASNKATLNVGGVAPAGTAQGAAPAFAGGDQPAVAGTAAARPVRPAADRHRPGDLQGGLGGPSTTAITASFTTCTICSRSALPTCTWPERPSPADRQAAVRAARRRQGRAGRARGRHRLGADRARHACRSPRRSESPILSRRRHGKQN